MSQIDQESSKLSSLQLELLKVYALDPTPQEIEDIRQILGQYFGKKLASKVGEHAEQQGISEDDVDQWLNEET